MARKWRCSNKKIHDIGQLYDSMVYYGGVWNVFIKRFVNTSFLMSQQFRTLLVGCSRGCYYYPEKIEKDTEAVNENTK